MNHRFDRKRSRGAATASPDHDASPLRSSLPNRAASELAAGRLVLRSPESAGGAGPLDPAIASTIHRAIGGGRGLDDESQGELEQFYGTDLSGVRIHDDAQADELAQSVQAKAFTTGSDVFFRSGHYQPNSTEGKRLLAHEIAHVTGPETRPSGAESQVLPAESAEEQRADRAADDFVGRADSGTELASGAAGLPGSTSTTVAIQRSILDDIVEGAEELWSDVKEWVVDIVDAAELRDKIAAELASTPVSASKIIGLLRRSEGKIRRALYQMDDVRDPIVAALDGEDRVRVLSAMLKGSTYRPDWQADLYGSMSAEEQELINETANGWFARETGIERALSGSSRDAPLVRRWLQLRDEAVDNDIKRDQHEKDEAAKYQRRYKFYLNEAVNKMNGVKFPGKGSPSALDLGQDLSFKYWDLVEDKEMAEKWDRKNQGQLKYNGTAPYPAMAVDELFEPANLKVWVVDCAEFTQAAGLYARARALGDYEFTRAIEADGGNLTLRLHKSSQYDAPVWFQSAGPGLPMTVELPDGSVRGIPDTAEDLMKAAPVGSRIVWCNDKAAETASFRNENSIKLNDTEFAAHGYEKKRFTASEMAEALALKTYEESSDGALAEYIENNVYVRSIEFVIAPQPE